MRLQTILEACGKSFHSLGTMDSHGAEGTVGVGPLGQMTHLALFALRSEDDVQRTHYFVQRTQLV